MKIPPRFAAVTVYTFALLGCILIPFPFHLLAFLPVLVNKVTLPIIDFVARSLFHIQIDHPTISSDSAYLYLLFGLLFIAAAVISSLLVKLKAFNKEKYIGFIRLTIAYYLSLQLLKYGFGKIFKGQFYLPEPNILYTPFGRLDRDILYWSTIGISYGYNVFLGIVEICAAAFLLHFRIRLIGALLAFGVLLNVVAVNFGFDISVKIFALFLLLLSILLLAPHAQSIWKFFSQSGAAKLATEFKLFDFIPNPLLRLALSLFLVLFAFSEAFYPGLKSFNDDTAPRPYLHGAYRNMNRSASLRLEMEFEIERVFIHRRGYIIFQDPDDRLRDFELYLDSLNGTATLTDYDQKQLVVNFYIGDNELLFLENPFSPSDTLQLKALDWKSLPAMQEQFHWNVESYE